MSTLYLYVIVRRRDFGSSHSTFRKLILKIHSRYRI